MPGASKFMYLVDMIKALKILFFLASFFLILLILLAFTPVPFHAFYNLGTSQASILKKPDYIILLGGSGMPSENNLIRLYYATRLAEYCPESRIIIALPGDTANPESSVNLMRREMILRGCDSSRISLEPTGKNTRAQAIQIRKMTDTNPSSTYYVVVTSPEHLYRAVLTLRKSGLYLVGGVPAFENPNESEIRFDDLALGGKNKFLPKIGDNLTVRYNFWTQLHYEIMVIREYLAIAWYGIKGWI